MIGFGFSKFSGKAAESHTEKYPLPLDVIRFIVNETLDSDKDSWCHFDDEFESVWAEVAPDKVGILINLPFPYKENPEIIFQQKDIKVPSSWEIFNFKKKSFFSSGFITYRTSKGDIDSVINFIDDFFKKLSQMGYDYKLSGSVNN